MIAKNIHYVWLSGSRKPEEIERCIKSWRDVLPDYSVREWNMNDFSIDEMPCYVREAIAVKKWAFATDYLRLWILYHEGGIYLDSDVLMRKNIDEFLDNDFFSFIEYHEEGFRPYKTLIDKNGNALVDTHIPGFCIQAAFMGAVKGNGFVRDCMEYYKNRSFLSSDVKCDTSILAPDIYALCARKYGFVYKDCLQTLGNRMTIYPSSYCGGTKYIASESNYAVHCCAGSWREKSFRQKIQEKISEVKQVIKIYHKFVPGRGKAGDK